MLVLIAGLVIFLGFHSVRIAAPQVRDGVIAERGEKVWRGLYSVGSLIGLVLIVWGYGIARTDPIPVWDPPIWTRHLAFVLMLPAMIALVASNAPPGRIKLALKHPMLVSIKIWALSHLLANGTLADIVLFGAFLAWAVADRISVAKRPVDAGTADVPASMVNDVIVVLVGTVLWALFLLWLHTWLIGVSLIG